MNPYGSGLKFIWSLIITIIIIGKSQVLAGPFIKLKSIDAESDFPQVNLFLTVKDIDNTVITGLDEENILLYEDDYRVNYVTVKSQSNLEDFLYLVFSIDTSKSISRQFLAEIKRSAKKIANNAQPNDKIAVFRFNDEVTLLTSFTNNKIKLFKNIEKVQRHGTKTMLYNCIYDSINLLTKADVLKKAVIVFTDGKDEGSTIEVDDIINYAKENDIPIYFICSKSSQRKKILSRISKITGGRVIYNHRVEEVNSIYRTIVNMLNNHYMISYQSMAKPDGKSHKVEVRLKYGSIRDRDSVEFSTKRGFDLFHFKNLSEILLLGLIFLLLLLLVFIIIYSFRRNSKIIERLSVPPKIIKMYHDSPKDSEVYDKTGDLMEIESDPENYESLYSKPWLMRREGPEKWGKIPIVYKEFTLGSGEGNHLVIDDDTVSPRHAKIKRVKNSYYLFDLASDFGTYLNDKKLLRPKALYDWDEIRIGKAYFIFRGTNMA
ncbi:MAG: VWA domain-containing protein [Spirochaetota bacterium]|nr:VWA domain-containing protein [Spirochaetota bacterium]